MVKVEETTQGVLDKISEGFAQKGAFNLRQNGISICHGDSEQKEQSKVLVAYYKDERQLHLTLKHKLYYVRTGFRRGALQIPVGTITPDYLLLHNGKRRFLFTLTKDCPETISAPELTTLGFTPSGGEYLVFKLKELENILIDGLDIMKVKIRGTGKNTALPYITNIIELFNS